MKISRLTLGSITALILYVGFYPGTMALGQGRPAVDPNASTLPDAPAVAWQQQNRQNTPASSGARDGASAGQVPNGGKQTKRILYIVPNFRAVSVDEKLPPQTIKDKFTTGALDSVDYS
jgi:uracil-DNA glycosylase